jgi:hypothetical protein
MSGGNFLKRIERSCSVLGRNLILNQVDSQRAVSETRALSPIKIYEKNTHNNLDMLVRWVERSRSRSIKHPGCA